MSREIEHLEQALQAIAKEGDVVLQAVAAYVFMDQNGEKRISHRVSTDLRSWEARGLVEDLRDTMLGIEIFRQFDSDDDPDEAEDNL